MHNCYMHKIYTAIQFVPILPELPISAQICPYLYDLHDSI